MERCFLELNQNLKGFPKYLSTCCAIAEDCVTLTSDAVRNDPDLAPRLPLGGGNRGVRLRVRQSFWQDLRVLYPLSYAGPIGPAAGIEPATSPACLAAASRYS